jgi:hypothetical protein
MSTNGRHLAAIDDKGMAGGNRRTLLALSATAQQFTQKAEASALETSAFETHGGLGLTALRLYTF